MGHWQHELFGDGGDLGVAHFLALPESSVSEHINRLVHNHALGTYPRVQINSDNHCDEFRGALIGQG
jgi:hypothetical protein